MSDITFKVFLDTKHDANYGRCDDIGTYTVKGEEEIVTWMQSFITERFYAAAHEGAKIATLKEGDLYYFHPTSKETFLERYNKDGDFNIIIFVRRGSYYFQPIEFLSEDKTLSEIVVAPRECILRNAFREYSTKLKVAVHLLEFRNGPSVLDGTETKLDDLRKIQNKDWDEPVTITYVRKTELELNVHVQEHHSLRTVRYIPLSSKVCDFLREVATRYGHSLEGYTVKVNGGTWDIDENNATCVGELGCLRNRNHPVISIRLRGVTELSADLGRATVTELGRKRTLAMLQQMQRVTANKEDEERMVNAAVVEHAQRCLSTAVDTMPEVVSEYMQACLDVAINNEKDANRRNRFETSRRTIQVEQAAENVSQIEAKRQRIEQEISKAVSLATEAEPEASEAEPVAAPVVKYTHMEPPNSFFCPISHELMRNPMMLIATGRTYEADQIASWLVNSDTDPMTNEVLANKDLISNWSLKQAIAEWSERTNQ